jgi:hypothetical protein
MVQMLYLMIKNMGFLDTYTVMEKLIQEDGQSKGLEGAPMDTSVRWLYVAVSFALLYVEISEWAG